MGLVALRCAEVRITGILPVITKHINLNIKAMLSENLTLTDGGALGTNIGATGSRAFNLVANSFDGSALRRYAATATTDRMELLVRHALAGKGFSQRTRSNIKFTYTKVNQDTSTTGGIVPSVSSSWTLDRPTNMGTITTDALCTSLTAFMCAMLLTSGMMASLYNLES